MARKRAEACAPSLRFLVDVIGRIGRLARSRRAVIMETEGAKGRPRYRSREVWSR